MSYTILIKYINAKKVNVLSSNYAITPMPISAIGFFSHLIALKGLTSSKGFAVIHHNSRYNAEKDRGARFKNTLFQQFRAATFIDSKDHSTGNSSKNASPLSLQPSANESLSISLLIECSSKPDIEAIKEHLRYARIAGGDIASYSSIEVFNSGDDLLELAIPSNGFWFVDRKDLIDEQDPAQSFVSALGLKSNSWLVPAVPGYALTTKPESNVSGTRLLPDLVKMDHAYAEPLLSLGQYISIRHFDNDIPFWRPEWITDSIYVFQQNQ